MTNKSFPSTGDPSPREEKKTKLATVTHGVVSTEKRSGFMEKLGVGDPTDIKSYLLTDILIPAAKNLIGDLIGDGIHMLLWGTPAQKGKGGNGVSRISYSNYYSGNNNNTKSYNSNTQQEPRPNSSAYKFDDIIISSRAEAEEVLVMMREILDVYSRVSIADYYELVGVTGQYTDCNYGWENLSGVDVQRSRNGYFLNLPKAMPIK